MTRKCEGYEGYDCTDPLEGRTARARRCATCGVKNQTIRSNAAAKRRAEQVNANRAYEFEPRELYPVRAVR